MKKIMWVFAAVLASGVGLNHGMGLATEGKASQYYSDVKTITKEELSKKLADGEPVQVVNVLSSDYYKLGIIQGSKKIPLDELDGRIDELDKTKEVVTYCANSMCTASMQAARDLAAKGFNVRAYEGGIDEWKKAGLPVDPQK